MKRNIKRYFILISAITEVAVLTTIYYYFWRIGYTHGIEGYPEYLGAGKFILMGVYAALAAILLYFTGAFRFGRLRVGNIIIRQWGVMLAVNIITFMQLSLTAKHLVAKRPMFDATVAQVVLIALYTIAADFVIKRYSVAGKMLAIGNTEIKSLDGYKITETDTEKHTMVDISSLFKKTDEYDAVLIQERDETSEYLIKHCMEKKKAVYFSKKDPTIYGVKRMRQNGINYILVLGMDEGEGKFLDRARAYLT